MKCHSDRPRGRRQAWGAAGSAVLPGVRAALRAEHARPQQRFLQRRCAEDPEHVVMAAARAFVGPGPVEKGMLVFRQLFWGNRRESGREVPQRACGAL